MAARQKTVVWIGVALIVGTGLYPPWVAVWGREGVRKPAGYHWLLFPPPDQILEIDLSRLLVEWTLIVAIAAALIWATPSLPIRQLTSRLASIRIPTFGPKTEWIWCHIVSPALLVLSILWLAELGKPYTGLTRKVKLRLDQFFGFEYWGVVPILILIAVNGLADLRNKQIRK